VLKAADILDKDGIKVDIINARFASPLDGLIVELARTGKKLITVEDHFRDCGFGSCVLEAVSAAGLPASVKVLGVPRGIIPHDSRHSQLMAAGLNADGIVRSVKELI
jgi:1-deoxy-D-xylulose-5-phosphate synthase